MSDTSLLFTIFAVDKATNVLGKVGGTLNKVALGVAALGAVTAVKTTKMAADFQTNMLRIRTGAGELQSNMAMVSNGVLNVATATGDSTAELARGLYVVESAGQHGADGLTVLRDSAEGAKAEGADLTTVADALSSALQDYHLHAKDGALVTSQMVTAVAQGKTTFQELAGSLHSVLPLASGLHIPLSDILGDLAAMTVHGESADQSTQNLADTIRHMAAPTTAMTKYLAQLGVNSGDLSGMLSSKGLSGTLQYLSGVILTKMGPSGKVLLGTMNQSKVAAAAANQMIGAMPANLQVLAHQFQSGAITTKQWRDALKELPTTQANLMQQYAVLQKRASGFSDALKAGGPTAQSYTAALKAATGDATGLNVALMLTGENAGYTNTAISNIANASAEAGGHVKGWGEIQATFNQRLAESKEQAEVLGIRIGTVLLPVMQHLLTIVSGGVTWFMKHKAVAQDLAIAFGVLAAAVLMYKIGQIAVNVVDKAALVIGGLKTAALWAGKVATGAYAVAQLALTSSTWAFIAASATDLANWLRKAALVAWNTGVMVAHEVAIGAVTVATKAWAIAQWALDAAMDANPIGLVIIAIAALAAGILYLWNHSKAFRNFFEGMWHGIQDAASTAIHWVTTKIDGIVNFVKSVPGKISAAARGMWDGIKEAFRGAINWIIGGWDDLHFSIPSFDVFGITVGGFNLGLPHIDKLARGGTTTRDQYSIVGENGPELAYTPMGTSVVPLSRRNTGSGGGGGPATGTVCICVHTDLPATVTRLGEHVRGQYGGDVQAAFSGHVS